jgi:acyl carrier protein
LCDRRILGNPGAVFVGVGSMLDEIVADLARFITVEILKQPDRSLAVDEPLISSGLVDSFSLVDLALHVEDTFGVRIEDTELNASTFDTLAKLAALIGERRGRS